MALEIIFGTGLGVYVDPENTILRHAARVDLLEDTHENAVNSLHKVMVDMVRGCFDWAIAPVGQRFYFMMLADTATLGLDLPQIVKFNLYRTNDLNLGEQLRTPAENIIKQLCGLGRPSWVDPSRPRLLGSD